MLFKNQGLLRCNVIMATCILLVQFSMSPVSASTYFSDSGSAIGILPGHQYGRTYQSCIAEGYTDCEWPSSAFLYSANGYVCANSGYLWYGYVGASYWHNPTNYRLDSGGVTYGPNCITLSPGTRTLSNQRDSTYIIVQVGNSDSFVPNASFTSTPLSGTAPLAVQFTDTSVGSPTSWSWSFGDDGTSLVENPSHTYTTAGTYSVSLTAANTYGSDTETKQGYLTVTGSELIADFTATPLTGTVPMNVTFTDLSTGSPASWLWDFGDGGTSTAQNPVHMYNTYGTHTVKLTVTNGGSSNSSIKPAYIMGTGGTYRVFAEGVGDYPDLENDLTATVPLAHNFYTGIQGSSGDTTWMGYYEHFNESAGSKYWSVSESSAIKADDADFALFAGHGNNLTIVFGTNNSFQELNANDMRFGTTRAKWVTFASCLVLNRSHHDDMNQTFNGLHILNGYDTIGFPYSDQGTQFAQRMKGTNGYQVRNIRTAWKNTLIDTIIVENKEKYSGAWMWAEPCSEDYLPGYGTFCSAPAIREGAYDVRYDYFPLGDN